MEIRSKVGTYEDLRRSPLTNVPLELLTWLMKIYNWSWQGHFDQRRQSDVEEQQACSTFKE